jgi:hypothetical protein
LHVKISISFPGIFRKALLSTIDSVVWFSKYQANLVIDTSALPHGVGIYTSRIAVHFAPSQTIEKAPCIRFFEVLFPRLLYPHSLPAARYAFPDEVRRFSGSLIRQLMCLAEYSKNAILILSCGD